jgi:Holliday junction resolvase RusA-like endonuclease
MNTVEVIKFTVPAVPIAQPRPRAVAGGGGSAYARMIEASSSHPVYAFKASVRMAAAAAYEGPPLDVPLQMSLLFVMPRPQSMRWKTRTMPRAPYCAKKKDWDNLGKAVSDALNEVLYTDDGLLWNVNVTKVYAAGDEAPHVEVTVTRSESTR